LKTPFQPAAVFDLLHTAALVGATNAPPYRDGNATPTNTSRRSPQVWHTEQAKRPARRVEGDSRNQVAQPETGQCRTQPTSQAGRENGEMKRHQWNLRVGDLVEQRAPTRRDADTNNRHDVSSDRQLSQGLSPEIIHVVDPLLTTDYGPVANVIGNSETRSSWPVTQQ
jgi:hypothetical protein